MSGTLMLAVVCMLVPVLAKYSGYGMTKYTRIVGVSGLFFMLSIVFTGGIWTHESLVKIGTLCNLGTHFLGFLGLLIGTLMGAMDLLTDTGHETV